MRIKTKYYTDFIKTNKQISILFVIVFMQDTYYARQGGMKVSDKGVWGGSTVGN